MTKDSKLPDKNRYDPHELAGRIREGTPSDLLALAEELDGLDGYQLTHEDQMDQRIQVYPGRRRIVVDAPTDHTRRTLGNFAHVEGTPAVGDGATYEIDDLDIWTSPYESFGALRADLEDTVAEVPESLLNSVAEAWQRGNAFRLVTEGDYTILEAATEALRDDVALSHLEHNTHYTRKPTPTRLRLKKGSDVVADVKDVLMDAGYPPRDDRDLEPGASLDIDLSADLELRDYQQEWVERFAETGAGVIDAPSGSGKTVGALGIMAAIGEETLIITPRVELARQWRRELLEKTSLTSVDIGEYHGDAMTKRMDPVTIATYDTASMSRHRDLFDERDWGLVVYDEVHHAPSDVWKRTADLQAKRRLGLTATPVRHEGEDEEIFRLIGPSISTDWHRLFEEGWVNRPDIELRFVPWGSDRARNRYKQSKGTRKSIAAARNPAKYAEIDHLLDKHEGEKVLIFAGWRDAGEELSDRIGAPYIHGDTPHKQRDLAYSRFGDGVLNDDGLDTLIVSRIADEGIDLPDVDVVIMASLLGGSRRQGGQRVGRVMRPLGGASVYLLATRGSNEEDQARESLEFMQERGLEVVERGAETASEKGAGAAGSVVEQVQSGEGMVTDGSGGDGA